MMPELAEAVKDFYNLTGIKTVLYDADRKFLYSYPKNMCGFCDKIRKCKSLTEKCFECDKIGFDASDKTLKPYIYKCHMGLSEIITPIVENGVIIGYMMMGQILMDGDDDKARESVLLAEKKYSVDKNVLLSELDKIKPRSPDIIDSAIGVMLMCISYLYANNIIMRRDDSLGEKLKRHIEKHLDGDLSIETLCKMLYISKSKLYSVSKSEFDMGISDYIRLSRMEKAKKLLLETDKKISDISVSVGYPDSNYFIRAFKGETGVTPKKYRESKTD